ncbi:IMS domain-containing protein [Nodularia sphaerocarpa]|uniref:IMS domain-containing protein n=1 Tax=Nodularia sphaerocarpa TaxID=137816 RepID=UPI001EFAE85D|nr:IMS domain-containing protein [Nodularia sphaerocarpa]MDB9373623.1 IMS domain-containing protein [Nodularia sphaerocarpa CS-585]MDB9380014.1 IMS domain-containing protein [Nodularia sphaerocarpa CS-585A2]ULP74412.1 Chaperone protein DnaJ [Nodularia sphaerocarpa UHCC 0038]
MRIPLDYYRILGLPLAASDEQLRQSYSDRIMQLPRREYSQAAISSRKQLIQEAYVVLSNPKERSSYDQLYLAHAYGPDGNGNATVAVGNHTESNNADPDIQSLSIDISQEELVGALLILQELGEYELVLKLGHNYLTNQSGVGNNVPSARVANDLASEEFLANSDYPDIVLTVALACLELGREHWQQGYYENAAVSLETGQELLAREGLFASVQAEMQADLYKLRPYRILELLALPEEKVKERRQGLAFLHDILSDRGGIDGTGNDQSGLNIDDFLRFIQQLRNYLTVAEQHKLFEAESKRPSAVATYLAVYALLARGFTQRQPALIRQAKQMLMRLGKRQDVHLEQSLCALLLGQTEEATRVLELSQEYEALALIREKSLDSPDLLPGLCLYAEQWLQNEVFLHFRDLAKQQAALKDYFANQQVQAYLEALPTDAQTTKEWAVINRQSFSQPPLHNYHSTAVSPQFGQDRTPDPDLSATPAHKRQENGHFSPTNGNTPPDIISRVANSQTYLGQFSHPEPTARGTNHDLNGAAKSTPTTQVKKRRRRKPHHGVNRGYPQQQQAFAATLEGKTRLVWTVFGSLAGILVFWLLVSTTFGWVKNLLFPAPVLQGEQLFVQLNEPPINIPDPSSKLQPPEGSLTEVTAQEVIQTWLSTKAAALGPKYNVDSLQDILTDATLSQWRLLAQQERLQNRHRTYNHTVKVEYFDQKSDKAVVVATVREVTQFYDKGQIRNFTDETLRVRYSLIRQADVWRIQNMSVIN